MGFDLSELFIDVNNVRPPTPPLKINTIDMVFILTELFADDESKNEDQTTKNRDQQQQIRKQKPTSQPKNIGKEDDEGNMEYKRSLVNPTKERLEHLTTQLNFRLNEGSGESIYQIGVEDNGDAVGIPEDSLTQSLATFTGNITVSPTISCFCCCVSSAR